MVGKYTHYTLLHSDYSITAYWNVLARQAGSNSNSCIFSYVGLFCTATAACLSCMA